MDSILERKAATTLAVVCQEKRGPLRGYEKLLNIRSHVMQQISVDERGFLNLMYENQILSFTNCLLDLRADVLG